ncbi:hypothetical protein TA3x_000935 [Tundrisphaera sp. TA3]|uniref:hypothetical protein n=1 Tax=Tundrisphaera sp. TA3 TaxID=3435775 RepID=UPI003EC12CA5
MRLPGDELTLQIDRLVDGELGEAERRALLLRLESDPDGWRRCALAFLEDQAFRSVLGGPASPIPLVRPVASHRRPRRAAILLGRLSLAAGVIAATFAAGFHLGGTERGRDPIAMAQAELPESPAPEEEDDDAIKEVGWALVGGEAAGGDPGYRVPILAGSGLDEQWLQSRPSTVPDYIRAQWEREGYQVAERRRLMSLNLDDGRKLAIPMANVELEYVGQDAY